MTGITMIGSGPLLEVALMVLLAATMFHAFRLEKALGVLRRDRASLEQLVNGFNESTRQAELSINRLQAAADGAGRHIARQVEQAHSLKSDLEFLTSRGEKLANRLDSLVRAAKPPEALAAEQHPTETARASVGAVDRLVARSNEVRPRSQAEKDLVRALRSAG